MNLNEEAYGKFAVVFLHLLREGGWHTCKEVFASAGIDARNRSALLAQMVNGGYLAKRPGPDPGSMVYGVTSSCRVPRFVSIGDVASAVGG